MEQFGFYFTIGCEHILSAGALDHILFIACLAVLFQPNEWRKLLILLTAFTIGHSLTLALNIFGYINLNEYWVELFIPITIIITAVLNIIFFEAKKGSGLKYGIALGFGLVHGLAYSSNLRFMLLDGQQIGYPLLAFNLGIEFGQMIVAAIVVVANHLFIQLIKRPVRYWIYFVSLVSIGISAYMILKRL